MEGSRGSVYLGCLQSRRGRQSRKRALREDLIFWLTKRPIKTLCSRKRKSMFVVIAGQTLVNCQIPGDWCYREIKKDSASKAIVL